ncbi:glycosyltransferase, partial [bacterium]|nr:glycosyltransferase [bacterium]
TGWPWTEESSQLPGIMPDGSPWPKVSIVTPSLNQGQFIEETIRSVLLQGYCDLEYIIIDGGSTDGAIEIIKKYEKWLTYWVSEKDHGQAHAINKGLKQSKGSLAAWLNSDDLYLPRALYSVSILFSAHQKVDMIYGDIQNINEKGELIRIVSGHKLNFRKRVRWMFIPQPSCFWRANLFKKIGYLNETYNYIFDLEYWIRAAIHAQIMYSQILLANFRIHKNAKTQKNNRLIAFEGISMYENLFSDLSPNIHMLRFKRSGLGYWHEMLAFSYFEEGLYQEARHSFLKSISFRPDRLQNITLTCYIIDTFLHTNLGKTIQKVGTKLRAKQSIR